MLLYLAVIQAGGRIIGERVDPDEGFDTAGDTLRSGLIPIAISAGLAVTAATWLGWWPQIVREPLRTRRWVGAIPITLLAVAVVGSSWGNLADQDAGLVAVLVAMVCLVGFTEELMFRGIGLIALRRMGLREGRVALYSSLLFGAVHLSNALGRRRERDRPGDRRLPDRLLPLPHAPLGRGDLARDGRPRLAGLPDPLRSGRGGRRALAALAARAAGDDRPRDPRRAPP